MSKDKAPTTQPRTLKGFRDFPPETALKREYLVEKIRQAFQRYGYVPIETPALEYLETFQGQIGEEEKLFYQFRDRGGRQVALRYDQTVPAARVMAQYQNKITLPFKRYQIQTVWRAEKPQAGRFREFLQADADIFGVNSPQADAEVIALSMDIFRQLGFKKIKTLINDRALLADIPYPVIASIDKLKKLGRAAVLAQIAKKGFTKKEAANYLSKVRRLEPSPRLKAIFNYLQTASFPKSWYQFTPTLVRSFSYSTGPIWEIEVPGYTQGSVLGGERYDQLVGTFSKKGITGTGFAVGFDRTLEAMQQLGLLSVPPTPTQVLVTIFSPQLLDQSIKLASSLRAAQINTDLYPDATVKLDKQIKYGNRKNIPLVAIIGPDEVESGTVTLKDMRTREQEKLEIKEVIQKISAKKIEKRG